MGAGAVVTRNVSPYAVVAGVPARVIKYRFPQPVIDALLRTRWWDWPESLIRERAGDFFSIEEFLRKYGGDSEAPGVPR